MRARGENARLFKTLARGLLTVAVLLLAAAPVFFFSAAKAAAEDRSLKLFFIHTGERATITFKRNGKFDPKGLAQINQFLRDWRKDRPTKMDPRLFDLVWEVYRRSGATDYIHVVSAFRSPETNGMLRGRSRNTGVAKNSQHMLGKAMDFFIPGVKLSTLRALAMQMQVGGVGFYPKSGSPFVHLDVGGVRAWPRMSRDELVQIFPKGNTIHLPADGKPLPGYDQALADYKKRVGADSIQIASTAGAGMRGDSSPRRPTNLLAFLFGGGGADEEEDNADASAPVAVAQRPAAPARPAPAPADNGGGEATIAVASAQIPAQPEIVAPVPLSRPAFRSDVATGALAGGLATALYSQQRNPAQEALALQASAVPTPQQQPTSDGYTDLSAYNIPVPTLLGPRGQKGDAESVMTASVGQSPALETMASIPMPTQRPVAAVASTVAMATPAVKPEEGKPEQQQALTPALVAELARGVEPKPAAPLAQPAPVQKPIQTAAISPKVIQSSARSPQFGDGFDMPKAAVAASAGALPVPGKGSRSGRSSPQAPSQASGGALTGDMLAKWALNNNRVDTAASMKAPRVVSRTLNSEYSAAYSGGFKPVSAAAAAAIDAGRFGN